ncbi:hypothetical protein DSBG_1723 [Desulfosporosinus sp. BG]|nr:hypothetical protein DSBG_1723 [Desulfosporosinus sp. BG]
MEMKDTRQTKQCLVCRVLDNSFTSPYFAPLGYIIGLKPLALAL